MEIGWSGKFKELKDNQDKIEKDLIDHIGKNFKVSESQKNAWKDSIKFLIDIFQDKYNDLYLAMEYTLPRMSGKRPDVILFFHNEIVILEFKMKEKYSKEDILQVIEYQESLKKYHEETWKKKYSVKSYLVLTKNFNDEIEEEYGVKILNNKSFFNSFIENKSFMKEIDVKSWINSNYAPLPEVIEGAINLFKNNKLPDIKNIDDSILMETEKTIKNLINKREGKKQVILVAGVPGSGKTLLGLKFNYFNNEKGIATVYISGNGPLINILQNELGGDKGLITSILNYINTYYDSKSSPREEVIIFDEAQRAWNEKEIKGNKLSEVAILLEIGNKIFLEKNSATIIALVGFGQEIHNREEEGINLWFKELEKDRYSDWNFFIPKNNIKLENKNICILDSLYINTSIRSDFINITEFKNLFLNKKKETSEEKNKLKKSVEELYKKGYRLYWTKKLETVEKYLKYFQRKSGILGSSGVEEKKYKEIFHKNVKTHLTFTESYSWYKNRENTVVATEFVVQGLDIDYPLVVFGGDYYLENGEWKISKMATKKKSGVFLDSDKLFRNIYNVLLTRGRKGMLLYFPEKIGELKELAQRVKDIGIIEK